MLSSGKTHQITRQKNIDIASVTRSRRSQRSLEQRVASKLDDDQDLDEYTIGDDDIDEDYLVTVAAAAMADDHTFVGDIDESGRLKNEIELINESLSKLTTRLIRDDEDACFRQFDFNSSAIAAIHAASNSNTTPSTSSSSSSPSNLPPNPNSAFLNTPEHNLKSISNRSLNSTSQSSDSSSSASVSPAPYASLYVSASSSPTTKPTSLQTQVLLASTSPSLNQRRMSKSPVNGKQLVATNSLPVTQPKPKRLASLMRLSSNGGVSFFSRSCPGDDADSAADEHQNGQNYEDSKNVSKTKNHEVAAGRNLGKSLFAFAARASRAVKKSRYTVVLE